MRIVRIAARNSDLARLQAYRVGRALQESLREKNPVEVQYFFKASLGDQNQHDPLWKMPEKGVFTEDFVQDLAQDNVDLVVHSWKDLPTEPRKGTEILCTLPREDVRDLVLFRRDALPAVQGSARLRVLTSSPRRVYNLEPFFQRYLPFRLNSVEFLTVRGNIPTRVRKLMAGEGDALVLAKAALDRLLSADEHEFQDVQKELRESLEKCQWMLIPLSLNPAAAAQGALAVEAKPTSMWAGPLREISCGKTMSEVNQEREILKSYGGGCHQKIGVTVISRAYGQILFLRGLTDSGVKLSKRHLSAERPEQSPKLRLAEQALFPQRAEPSFFDRRPLAQAQPKSPGTAFWVARENAWPKSWVADASLIWTAGLKTWQSLAQQGLWVNGSAESLGESEEPKIEILLGQPAKWYKLTHDGSAEVHARMQNLATYQLEPKVLNYDWSQKKACYWMSISSFERCLQLGLPVQQMHHSSGPGLTHQHLMKRLKELGVNSPPSVFLDSEEWRASMTGD